GGAWSAWFRLGFSVRIPGSSGLALAGKRMSSNLSPGARFRAAVEAHRPLQVVGTINAYTARMAKNAGHHAIYLSGGGVAANSLGMPDLGISTMDDVLTDI